MKELIREAIDGNLGGIKFMTLYSEILLRGDLALKTTTKEHTENLINAIESMSEFDILRYIDCNGHQHKFIYRKQT